jgi:dolichol-phosphate mannosyltransferase
MGRGRAFTAAQGLAAVAVLSRLARGRRRRAPLAAGGAGAELPPGGVSVVIPARDEVRRLGPCLSALRADPDVGELIVVDDCSTDATAALAREAGARVVAGAPLPAGWAGKPWALEQGTRAARGEVLVFLDADTRPAPGLVRAVAALAATQADLVSAAPRFVCEGRAERLLHAAMAVTIPYRAGPQDVDGWQPSARRALVNGQCLAARRATLLAAGGWGRVRGHLTEDVALARAMRGDGGTVAFVDAADLLEVRMYESARETWTGWGRSLMGADVNPPVRLAEDVATLWLTMALPLPRLLARRGTPLDGALLVVRLGLLAALARFYRPRGAAFWLSPLADVPALVRLTLSVLRPTRAWRGRTY